jgi:hypothetical protein
MGCVRRCHTRSERRAGFEMTREACPYRPLKAPLNLPCRRQSASCSIFDSGFTIYPPLFLSIRGCIQGASSPYPSLQFNTRETAPGPEIFLNASQTASRTIHAFHIAATTLPHPTDFTAFAGQLVVRCCSVIRLHASPLILDVYHAELQQHWVPARI